MVANPVSKGRLLSLQEMGSTLHSQLRVEAGEAGKKGAAKVIFKVAEVISLALVIPAGCDFPPTFFPPRNQSIEEGDRGITGLCFCCLPMGPFSAFPCKF